MKKPESMTEYMNLSTEDKMKLFRQETAPSSDTAQCDCSVCAAVRNDNFAVHGAHLRAEMTDDEDTPVRIERTSNK